MEKKISEQYERETGEPWYVIPYTHGENAYASWDYQLWLEKKVSQVEKRVMRKQPIAWACKTCGKIDWADDKEQKAQPEHITYRGVDLGTCKGEMIPLFSA